MKLNKLVALSIGVLAINSALAGVSISESSDLSYTIFPSCGHSASALIPMPYSIAPGHSTPDLAWLVVSSAVGSDPSHPGLCIFKTADGKEIAQANIYAGPFSGVVTTKPTIADNFQGKVEIVATTSGNKYSYGSQAQDLNITITKPTLHHG